MYVAGETVVSPVAGILVIDRVAPSGAAVAYDCCGWPWLLSARQVWGVRLPVGGKYRRKGVALDRAIRSAVDQPPSRRTRGKKEGIQGGKKKR